MQLEQIGDGLSTKESNWSYLHVPNGGIEMKNEGQEQTKAIAEIKKEVQLSRWQRQIEERQVAGLDVA